MSRAWIFVVVASLSVGCLAPRDDSSPWPPERAALRPAGTADQDLAAEHGNPPDGGLDDITTSAHTSAVKLKPALPHDALFRALGDPLRLRLLLLLREGEVCVCHLVNTLGESQPLISKHLATLRRAGLVTSRKDGYWRHYSLAEPTSPAHAKLLALLDTLAAEHPDCERDRKKLEKVLAAARCCD